jgi:hypothetical protein
MMKVAEVHGGQSLSSITELQRKHKRKNDMTLEQTAATNEDENEIEFSGKTRTFVLKVSSTFLLNFLGDF